MRRLLHVFGWHTWSPWSPVEVYPPGYAKDKGMFLWRYRSCYECGKRGLEVVT